MPLINGQKMACEPCIRGHRSTKCTHANERLMVPVRKPGRPLSSCPHPPSRGCGCGSVTAAIPRKQKCNCGSSSDAKGNSNGEAPVKVEPDTNDQPPLSPTKSSMSSATSYRVQKSSSKPNSRKQSVGPASLERMDPSQINVFTPYDVSRVASPHHNGAAPGMELPTPGPSTEYSQIPMVPAPGAAIETPMAYPIFQPQMTPAMLSPEAQATSITPSANTLYTSAVSTPTTKPASTGGSCCSGGANKSTQATPPESVNTSPKAETIPNGGNCCSSKANQQPKSMATSGLQATSVDGTVNGMAMPAFQAPVPLGPQVYPTYYPHPTLFTYPAHYGSFMSPLQPAQWKQAIEALQYGQPIPQPPMLDVSTSLGFGSNGVDTNNLANGKDTGTSHRCTCGEACQCIGCAAHPYNEATQDYVRSALGSMGEEAYGAGKGVASISGGDATNGNDASFESLLSHSVGGHGTDFGITGERPGSPPPPQTPSSATSGPNEELSASDFFFVTYPFGGDSCSGETASCPCGDECQCLGCSIHNNHTAPVPGA